MKLKIQKKIDTAKRIGKNAIKEFAIYLYVNVETIALFGMIGWLLASVSINSKRIENLENFIDQVNT